MMNLLIFKINKNGSKGGIPLYAGGFIALQPQIVPIFVIYVIVVRNIMFDYDWYIYI